MKKVFHDLDEKETCNFLKLLDITFNCFIILLFERKLMNMLKYDALTLDKTILDVQVSVSYLPCSSINKNRSHLQFILQKDPGHYGFNE